MRNCIDCRINIDHLYGNMKRCKTCAHARELKRIRAWQRAKREKPRGAAQGEPAPPGTREGCSQRYMSPCSCSKQTLPGGAGRVLKSWRGATIIPLEAIETGMEL